MSDRFEEAVKSAASQLGESGDLPGYESAYRRGTIRLRRKRAALGAACALALFGGIAMTSQLDGFRSTTIETDEVAIPADAIPATAVPEVDDDDAARAPASGDDTAEAETGAETAASTDDTQQTNGGRGSRGDDAGGTEPAPFSPTPSPADSELDDDDARSDAEATPTPPAVLPTAVPTTPPVPTTPRVPTTPPVPTPTATPLPSPTALSTTSSDTSQSPPATATLVPTATATVVPTSIPTPSPTAVVAPPPTPTSTLVPVPTSTPTPQSAGLVPAPRATATATPVTLRLPSRSPAVDANTDEPLVPVVLVEPHLGEPLPCDIDRDGVPDGECVLLETFPCRSDTIVASGYKLVDTDGDQVADRCVPRTNYTCDTDFDDLGDTPCRYIAYP